MVASRRFFPLIVIVVLGTLGLMVRLYQVQIEEYEVWAGEARNLVRTARTIPYLRGKITDREGTPLVQDEEAFAVRFIYREFRREHPLGQVAHARSVLEHRSVGLQAAALHMQEWGIDLVESRAGDIEAFASGEAVELCGLSFPEVERGTDRRRGRAAELRFYIQGLLEVPDRQWGEIKKQLKKGKGLKSSWLELLSAAQEIPVAELRDDVARRMDLSLRRLQQLAMQLEVSSLTGDLAVTAEESLWYLIDGLEVKRREIEDAIAKDLFEAATGFDPGRIEPHVLLSLFDMHFVTDDLGWTPGRLDEWAAAMRGTWIDNRKTFHVPRAQISARLREDRGEEAEDALFGELAVLYARRPRTPREARSQSRDWQQVNQVAVFSELPELFDRIGLEGLASRPLPFLDESLRAARQRHGWTNALIQEFVPFEMAEQVALLFPPEAIVDWRGDELAEWQAPASLEEATVRIAWQIRPARTDDGALDPSLARDDEELLPWLEHLWEARYQAELNKLLKRVEVAARGAGFAMPLRLTEERLERAEKKLDYFVRDRGSRPERIDESPDDDVINTLTRYVKEYAGFEVEPRTRRLAMALDQDDVLVARELIGVVRESTLREVMEQRYERQVFSRILRKKDRSGDDEQQMDDLVSELYRADEVHGTSGIEGLMDGELRGHNGFETNEGMQQREEESRASFFKPKLDGHDVTLTLSIDLQMAAQNVIEHPTIPRKEDRFDKTWFRNPVGAIVFATVDGEILAAASGPKQPHEPAPARDGERAYNYDRTLRMPLFQPMGSIFKPFVAAYALGRRGLDPELELACKPRPSGSAGWGKVACHSYYGHDMLALDQAIQVSCNAYFAQVGEMLEDKQGVRELAHMFGFDQPTGVRDPGGGRGLFEIHRMPSLQNTKRFTTTDLNRAGNGLAVIEATPVQVARAVAGLATGRLPRMRLVRAVDGVPVIAETQPIDLPYWALERVRRAMEGVVTTGSAKGKGLEERLLKFRVAGKTGSADYRPMTPAYLAQLEYGSARAPQMRKHTWFVSFFPAENPTNVLVIYCHDIGITAGHSAVYLAAQFLKSPAVKAYMKGAF